ncbi:MAG: TadE/TadG family type IV pilus assembly protein [Mycobacteriales bacterium]
MSRWRDEAGAAVVEFIFLGVLVLVPLFYVAIAGFEVQANVFATTQAAREAGRVVATAPDVSTGVFRAEYAVRLAYQDTGATGDAVLRFVPSGDSCDSGAPAPDPGAASVDAGATFTVCVVNRLNVPGVPTFMEGKPKTYTARYEVQIDKLRKAR